MLDNIIVKSETLDEAWLTWFEKMKECSESIESRDGQVTAEVINAITVIDDPTKNIMNNDIRKLSLRYAIGEMLWYLSGNPELKAIQHYTKAWDRMSDDGETVNSNYGYIIKEAYNFNQYEYCKQLLIKDKNSRQAIIHIKVPKNTLEQPTKDLNCTVCLQFLIRENKLYCTTYMRSNDLWLGFPYDIFQFTCIQVRMAMELGLEIGSYTHIAGSLHMYKRDFDKAIERYKEENNV
ncbi:thymidylate synthase [Eubacterium sp.]|jgi:thymidylate synthase|uniref:thymidylate synthase n=1 Tax=Eubacterium sp. TaxID=142586 RepID=UPI003A9112D4